MLRRIALFTLALGLLAGPALAADPAATETLTPAAHAEALFKAGKILEARDAYAAAAKADPDDAALEHQSQLLSRVLELATAIQEEDVSPKWERKVYTLHGFYLSQGLAQNALDLDQAAYKRDDTAMTAGLVLESMLETGKDAGALKFAQGLREGQMNDGNRIYKNIAAARLGQKDLVKEDLDLYGTPEVADAGGHFDLARLESLMGQKEQALQSLKTAFETCPARGIPTLKTLAAASPDFKTLAGDAFQKVLQTKPKSSGCGDCGGGCGGCGEKSGGGCGGK